MTELAVKKNDNSTGARLIALAVLVLAVLATGFWWTARWMMVRWDQPNSYYSHGWLILPISAVLVYLNRDRLKSCRISPSAWGLALLLPGVLLQVVATAWQVGFLSGFALLAVLAGLVISLFGTQVFRQVWFPLAFLAFMVPVPVVLVDTVSFKLKLAAAKIAADFVGAFGLAAVRDGSYIRIPTGTIIVDDVCSGLKYLIALTAFGALYAYISPLTRGKKAVLFTAAIPVSFVANVTRVILMVLVAFAWGVGATEEWYFHDFFGFFLFVVEFVFLFVVESVLMKGGSLNRWNSGPDDDPDDGNSASQGSTKSADCGLPLFRGTTVLALGVLFGGMLLSCYLAWPRPKPDTSHAFGKIPKTVGEWQGADTSLSEREYELLGTDNVLSRVYRSSDNEPAVQLVIVVAEQVRRRTHPPEQCLTGSGWSLRHIDEKSVRVPLGNPSSRLNVRELVLGRNNEVRVSWYFFKSGSDVNTSYWRHQAGVALRKLWEPDAADVLIRFDVVTREGSIDEARELLRKFLARAVPPLMKAVP